jgi:uncharacterized membrane protein YjjB (DUF3815 family)
MTLVAAIGYAVSEIAESKFGTETATVLSALAIGLSGTLCSFVSRDIPLSMIFAGLQVLLPGGIGVQARTSVLTTDPFLPAYLYQIRELLVEILISNHKLYMFDNIAESRSTL